MFALSIVEDFDELKDSFSGFISGAVTSSIEALGFERRKETFGRGVVPAVPAAAHRASDLMAIEQLLKRTTGILTGIKGSSQQWLPELSVCDH